MLRSVPYWSVLATIVACVGMIVATAGVKSVEAGLNALPFGFDAGTGSNFGQIQSLANIALSVTFVYGAVRACVRTVCVHMRVCLRREGEGEGEGGGGGGGVVRVTRHCGRRGELPRRRSPATRRPSATQSCATAFACPPRASRTRRLRGAGARRGAHVGAVRARGHNSRPPSAPAECRGASSSAVDTSAAVLPDHMGPMNTCSRGATEAAIRPRRAARARRKWRRSQPRLRCPQGT